MNLREVTEQNENKLLSPYAVRSSESRGRIREEKKDDIRTCFQRDRDRIIHSKSLRRLMHKTQVFVAPEGDHYRTRLTHTLEVTQIGRTIARCLNLNEDLTEAIGMGHDLGHTPFGHAGERVLNERHPGGFEHNIQSLRVVDVIEKTSSGSTLNLTEEVRDGIKNHSGSYMPFTLEGQIIKFSDKIAYINHDIDDAIRAGIISQNDLPKDCITALGAYHGERINNLVTDIVKSSAGRSEISQSQEMSHYMFKLRKWLFENVYYDPKVETEEKMSKIRNLLFSLYDYYLKHPDDISSDNLQQLEKDGIEEVVKDQIAGMTDRYAISKYEDLFIPKSWIM